MRILIPIAIGQNINLKVFDGLRNQTEKCKLIICSSVGVINSERNYSKERIDGESKSRRLCQQEAKKLTDKYVLLLDSDIVLIDENAIKDLIKFLDNHEEVNAIALYFGKFPKITTKLNHIVIRCVLIRREIFVNMDLTFQHYDGCFCNVIKRGCNDKIEYLDFKKRAYEIL